MKIKFCLGSVLLIVTLILSVLFAHWVISESDDDLVHDALVKYGELALKGKRKEGIELLNQTLDNQPAGPLDPIWLKLVRVDSNGYERLSNYMRVLKSDPDLESTYFEISNFIDIAPQAFHDEVKEQYLSDMAKIPGINEEWLQKYNLVLSKQ